MLIPEIALFAGTGGVLLALVSCLLALSTRRQMNQKVEDLKLELDVYLSANHEMAKHLRALQKQGVRVAPEPSFELEDDLPTPKDLFAERERREDRSGFSQREWSSANESPAPREESGVSLAEKLGLSQSEANIITHLRPKRGLRESV